jgi:hypothetical protein
MTPVFGEFLRPARAHIAAACFGGDLPDAAKRGAIAELDRLVATISRYLDDLTLPADFTPASNVSLQQRAALEARVALHRAASSLHPAAQAVQETTADYTHPAVGHLSSANGYLAAGRDLVRTHFTSGPAAAPAGNSPWVAVITSEPVTAALLSELAACTRQLATWTAQLSATGAMNARLPAQGPVALQTASMWLRTAGTVIQTAQLNQPPHRPGAACSPPCNRTSRRPGAHRPGKNRSRTCATASPSPPSGSATRSGPSPPRAAGHLPPSPRRGAAARWHRPSPATPARSFSAPSPNVPGSSAPYPRSMPSWPAQPTHSAGHGARGARSSATGTPSPPASTTARASPPSPLTSVTSCCGPGGRLPQPPVDTRLRRRQPGPRPRGPRRNRPRHH